jgi:glycosyltransferase involved in cell wall biosynthesis
MRVMLVANTAWYLFNFRLNLMTALRTAGHTVIAVAPSDAYAERIRAAGFACEDIQLSGRGKNPLKELLSVVGLRRRIILLRPDVVLSYTPKGNIYSGMAASGLTIKTVPNVSGLGTAFVRNGVLKRIVTPLYRIAFSRAYHVFFQNQDDMDHFLHVRLVDPDKCERLPGSGVDLTRFTPQPIPETPADAPVFLLIARMMWDKGVGEYVHTARRVLSFYPHARFQLLGFVDVDNPSSISRHQIDEWVEEGLVEYLGATDDVRPYLARANCVVLPSYREGVPRTLLEAGATGRPVITTDAPGCRDAVFDGHTGLVCRPRSVDDLVAKVLSFIAMSPADRARMGRQARTFVEENFDERVVIDRYLEIIAGV